MSAFGPGSLSRRGFLGATAAAAAAACAPAASPGSPSPSPSSGPKAEWEHQWDDLIAAAKKEGKVVVHTATGVGYREYVDAFSAAFPGVEAEHVQFPDAATYVPKVTQERNAGIYSLDVALLPPTSVLQQFKPAGVLEQVRPIIFRPDVLDSAVWDSGFEGRWRDLDKKLGFSHTNYVNHVVWINTDVIGENEIKSADDVADPKWKGKLVYADPRQGAAYLGMSSLRLNGKADLIKKIIVDQQPMIIRDRRQAVEALVRGRVPIAWGLLPAVVNDFKNEGVGKGVKNLDLPEVDYQSSDCTFLYNKAPHPNAAKLFINWFLSKEGALAYSSNSKFNSARKDVPVVDQNMVPKTGVEYKNRNQEEIYGTIAEVQKQVLELTGG